MKIAVYAIAKDEAQHVERFMRSTTGADLVLVGDTGSTDETKMKLSLMGARVVDICISPWRFDDARNAVLALLPADIDVAVSLDLDEVLNEGWRQAVESAFTAGAKRLTYKYVWSHRPDGSEDITFSRDKIHLRSGYRWTGCVHENIAAFDGKSELTECPGLQVDHYPDASKSRSSYLPLLELAVKESPSDAMAVFYLAREYMWAGDKLRAISAFCRYLDHPNGHWPPAVSFAYRSLAKLSADDREEALLLRSCCEAPGEREPWFALLKHAYDAKDWTRGAYAASRAERITTRPEHFLTESEAWGAPLLDLASVCYWYAGMHDEGLRAGKQALALVPDDPRLLGNVQAMQANKGGV